MGPGGGEFQTRPSGGAGEVGAQADDLFARLVDVAADVGPDFDNRLVHLGLDLLLQRHFAFAENLLDMGTQLARIWVDDLKFFLDPESEDVIRRAHVWRKNRQNGPPRNFDEGRFPTTASSSATG